MESKAVDPKQMKVRGVMVRDSWPRPCVRRRAYCSPAAPDSSNDEESLLVQVETSAKTGENVPPPRAVSVVGLSHLDLASGSNLSYIDSI